MHALAAIALAGSPPPPDPVVEGLIAAGLAQGEAWRELVELCDDIGHRLAGSENLARAVAWAAERMREDGLRVELQPVDVPHWARGPESARLLDPVDEPLAVLGLGMTVPTPSGGLEAEVVVARDWAELDALGERVRGRIVLFDPPWAGYGETVPYRIDGADRAAAKGAVGVLLRSVTTESLATLHTGTLVYEGEKRIPAAAVTWESADRIRRWADRGMAVRVRMELANETLPAAPSANVVGEVVGRRKGEVVLLGCHLDSWDLGTGAQDDGAACVAVMEAVAQIAALPEKPKRTVRAVLFTNEENGVAGGKAYVGANAGLEHVALVESDTGMGGNLGFSVDAGDAERAAAVIPELRAMLAPLERLGFTAYEAGYAGVDVNPTLRARGGLGLGVKHEMSTYWPIHHTEADTVDKVDPKLLNNEVAGLAALAWILANADRVPGAGR